jgi:hypothetical protein
VDGHLGLVGLAVVVLVGLGIAWLIQRQANLRGR